jgi:hypothetical protein
VLRALAPFGADLLENDLLGLSGRSRSVAAFVFEAEPEGEFVTELSLKYRRNNQMNDHRSNDGTYIISNREKTSRERKFILEAAPESIDRPSINCKD